jgi:hypothetical protein
VSPAAPVSSLLLSGLSDPGEADGWQPAAAKRSNMPKSTPVLLGVAYFTTQQSRRPASVALPMPDTLSRASQEA